MIKEFWIQCTRCGFLVDMLSDIDADCDCEANWVFRSDLAVRDEGKIMNQVKSTFIEVRRWKPALWFRIRGYGMSIGTRPAPTTFGSSGWHHVGPIWFKFFTPSR